MMRALVVSIAVILSGCTSVKVKYESNNRYAKPKYGPVCILQDVLPRDMQYESIALIRASIKHYARNDQIAEVIANKARKLGADAIMNFDAEQIFRGPLPWGVVSPRGSGIAVRLLPGSPPLDCEEVGGITY